MKIPTLVVERISLFGLGGSKRVSNSPGFVYKHIRESDEEWGWRCYKDAFMTKTAKSAPEVPTPPPAPEDFARLIEQTVARQPEERVKCVRVFENLYRCNWWLRGDDAAWGTLTAGKIVKSKFLRATMTGDALLLDDLSQKR